MSQDSPGPAGTDIFSLYESISQAIAMDGDLRSQLDACRQECARLQEHNGELMKERDALQRQVDSIQKATNVTAS